jgi:hypothetical protein
MLQALSAPHCIDEHQLRVTGSIGIVVYPDHFSEPLTAAQFTRLCRRRTTESAVV